MSQCPICDLVTKKISSNKIYEDKDVVAFIDPNPVSQGHIMVMPKEHFPIMEQVPDELLAKTFQVTNLLSIALFEAVNAKGTNILINNGPAAGQDWAHFMINIIPRNENDGINFDWQPKQIAEEEMSQIELSLKSQFQPSQEAAAAPSAAQPQTEAPKKEVHKDDGENYLVKQLHRRP
ncbi:HIT family protein [Nanoarchaeota archaeon]